MTLRNYLPLGKAIMQLRALSTLLNPLTITIHLRFEIVKGTRQSPPRFHILDPVLREMLLWLVSLYQYRVAGTGSLPLTQYPSMSRIH